MQAYIKLQTFRIWLKYLNKFLIPPLAGFFVRYTDDKFGADKHELNATITSCELIIQR